MTVLPGRRVTLEDAFDWRANGLNTIRLVLASGVIFYHSFPLTGRDISFPPVRQLMGDGFVDGFFAASGFLIVASWFRKPDWMLFLTARLLRIMPAFWTCLILTAFVLAPALVVATAGPLSAGYWDSASSYVTSNVFLKIRQYDIDGTPMNIPHPAAWNGSLWTLWWEFLCYLGVLALGVSNLIRRKWTVELVFFCTLAATVLVMFGVIDNSYIVQGSRFGLMFAAGAIMYKHRALIPASWPLATAAATVVLASAWLPNYRVLGALPMAYLVVFAGSQLRRPMFHLRNDISYGVYIYAFPVQQGLAMFGLYGQPPLVFGTLALAPTAALAAASWWAVEKPALRLRKPIGAAIDRARLRFVGRPPSGGTPTGVHPEGG